MSHIENKRSDLYGNILNGSRKENTDSIVSKSNPNQYTIRDQSHSAILWRNSPTAARQSSQQLRLNNSIIGNNLYDQQRCFQQSLRQYPNEIGEISQKNFQNKIKPKLDDRKDLKEEKNWPNKTRCFVTSLEETDRSNPISPFYLDYLEWNKIQQRNANSNRGSDIFGSSKMTDTNNGSFGLAGYDAGGGGRFDHSEFMDILRSKKRNNNSNNNNKIIDNAANDKDCFVRKNRPTAISVGRERGIDSVQQNNDSLLSSSTFQTIEINSMPYSVNALIRTDDDSQQPKDIDRNDVDRFVSQTDNTTSNNNNNNNNNNTSSFKRSNNIIIDRRTGRKSSSNIYDDADRVNVVDREKIIGHHYFNDNSNDRNRIDCGNKNTEKNRIDRSVDEDEMFDSKLKLSSCLARTNRTLHRSRSQTRESTNQRFVTRSIRPSISSYQMDRSNRSTWTHKFDNVNDSFPQRNQSSDLRRDVSNHGRDNVVLPVNNNNSSLAFGSTQSRNIDLTRPLVMPGSTARPRSEIFPDNFNINQSIGSNSNQHQSHSDSTSVVYAKDDNIYRPNSSRPNDLFNQPISHNIRSTNSRNDVQQCWPEPVIVSKHQSQNHMFPGASSFLRAARRHDPELVPAKSKYLFRDYGAPSSGWSFSVTSSSVPGSNFKKESSLMTSSMTSTKSFQTKHFSALSGNSSSSNRPKKSFSMNRLDQLAQPRKRVKSNVPSSTSFVKGKIDDKSNEMTTSKSAQFDRNTVSSTSTSKITAAKTAPPNRGKVSKESPIGTFNRISSISTTPNSGKKPRPKSQVEPLNSSSPVFESPLSDEKQTEEDDGKLAEYKKQLAEKKAQYRKMQEQKLKQLSKSEKSSNDETKDEEKEKKNEKPVEISIKKQSEPRPVVPLRRPRSIIGASSSENGNQIKSLADETKEALEKKPLEQILGSESDSNLNNNASLSSNGTRMEDNQIDNFKKSQSSNSDADNIEMNITVDDIQNQSETVTVAVEIPIDQLNLEINQLSIDDQTKPLEKMICDDSDISCKDDSETKNDDKIMKISLEETLLNSSIPQTSSSSSTTQENVCDDSTKFDERQRTIIQQHEIERQKRKSRIQEILKGRTRKDDGKQTSTASFDSTIERNETKQSNEDDGSVERLIRTDSSDSREIQTKQTNGHLTNGMEDSNHIGNDSKRFDNIEDEEGGKFLQKNPTQNYQLSKENFDESKNVEQKLTETAMSSSSSSSSSSPSSSSTTANGF